MAKKKRSFGEALIAQWPGFLGFAFIGGGLLIVWDAKMHAPHEFSIRLVAVLIAIGMALLGYWAFANKNNDYNL